MLLTYKQLPKPVTPRIFDRMGQQATTILGFDIATRPVRFYIVQAGHWPDPGPRYWLAIDVTDLGQTFYLDLVGQPGSFMLADWEDRYRVLALIP